MAFESGWRTKVPVDESTEVNRRKAGPHKDFLRDILQIVKDLGEFIGVDLAAELDGLYASGATPTDALTVTASGSPDFNVHVAVGGAIGFGVWFWNHASHNEPATPSPSANDRWDLLQVNLLTRNIATKEGAENPAPVKPTLDANNVELCYIYRRPGESSIKDTDDASNGYIDLTTRTFVNA